MTVWIVWEYCNDYPENGGGSYLCDIFTTEAKAQEYCNKRNKEDGDEITSFYMTKQNVK